MAWDAFTSMAVSVPSWSVNSWTASSLVAKWVTEPPLWAAPSAIFSALAPMAVYDMMNQGLASMPSMAARAPML